MSESTEDYHKRIADYRKQLECEIKKAPHDSTQAGKQMFRIVYLDNEAFVLAKDAIEAELNFTKKHNIPFDPETMTLYGLSCGWIPLKGKEKE